MYIHERSDWPRFLWDAAALVRPLAAVRHRQGRLIGRMEGLGFSLREEAVLRSLTREVAATSEIEGERLDLEQVRSSIARRLGMDVGGLAPADRDVEGVVELTLDAAQRFDEPLSADRLFGWHAALFPGGRSGVSRIRVGAWRDGPMQVVSGPLGRERVHFEAPSADRLDGEMETFLSWFNGEESLDTVLKAALAHLWFVTIHPFDDGNGRIARAIGDMALARSEGISQRFYSLSAQIRAERGDYYALLETTQKGTLDVTEWLLWSFGCLDRAFEGSEAALAAVLRKARFWERYAGKPFNDRQRLLLNRLLDGFDGKLTSSKWATIARCSQNTAIRDIQGLIEEGVLTREEAGGRSASYALAFDSQEPSP